MYGCAITYFLGMYGACDRYSFVKYTFTSDWALSLANVVRRSCESFQSPASDQAIGLPLVRTVRMMVIVPSTSSRAISGVNTGATLVKICAASARLSYEYCQPRCEARRKR